MLFADNIVLEDGTRCGVNVNLEFWQNVLESKGYWLSMA